MAVIKSGASTDQLTIDAVSKAARITLYDSAGREISIGKVATFAASGAFTPAATPTDMVLLGGSATKTVRAIAMIIAGQTTAASSIEYLLVRRSTANTVGTFVAATAVKNDSLNAAATAVIGHYTANPTLGNTVGTVNRISVATPVLKGASWAGIIQSTNFDMCQIGLVPSDSISQAMVLRGTAEQLAINFAGAALIGGQIHQYTVLWTEE